MSEAMVERPARLWVVGGLNVINGLVAIGGLFLLAYAASVPDTLRPGLGNWLVGGGTALFLIISSVLTLVRFPQAQYAMLAAAMIFFGWIFLQTLELLLAIGDLGGRVTQARGFGTESRCIIMLALNLWAALSRPTRDFMSRAGTEKA
jgi:hypothetical protein